MKDIPVYRFPAAYARENNELELYRASSKANTACKEAIEKASVWIPSAKDIPSRSSAMFLQEAKRTIRSLRRNTRNEKSVPR